MLLSKRYNGVYYLWFEDERGLRRKVSTRTRVKSEAVKFLRSFKEQARELAPPIRLLNQFAAEYLTYSESIHRPTTTNTVKYSFVEFERFVGNRQLQKIGVRDIELFLAHKTKQSSEFTARKHYSTLAAAFERARKWGYIVTNPFRDAQKPKLREITPAHFTKPDFHRLLSVIADQDFRELCIMAVTTGLRLGELISLEWSRIDFERRLVLVESSDTFTTKSKRNTAVPISDGLWQLLAARKKRSSQESVFHLHGAAMKRSLVSHRFKEYLRSAGLNEKLHFHSLRHTFATWLVQARVSIFEVQRLLGHSSIQVTQIYSHLAPSELHEAVNRIPRFLPGEQLEPVLLTDSGVQSKQATRQYPAES